MLLTSEHQLDQVGAGIAALSQYGAGWVITQYEMTITRMPKAEEPVQVGTQAVSYNKLMTYRDYWIKAEDGTELARISGAWVMMDLETRKIIPMKSGFPEKVGAQAETTVRRYPRIGKVTEPAAEIPYRVRYFDIDGNGHVNNTHYLDWMEDSLGYDFLNSHELQHVVIKYAREVAYGTTPVASFQQEGNVTHHQIATDGESNAVATMTWREVE